MLRSVSVCEMTRSSASFPKLLFVVCFRELWGFLSTSRRSREALAFVYLETVRELAKVLLVSQGAFFFNTRIRDCLGGRERTGFEAAGGEECLGLAGA